LYEPPWAAWLVELVMTPLLAVQVVAPDSKPALPSSWAEVQVPPPPDVLTVQVKAAVPVAPVLSVTVTVVLYVPAVVGVPLIRPVELLIDRPVGRPVAA
jgi:hypothetical protein